MRSTNLLTYLLTYMYGGTLQNGFATISSRKSSLLRSPASRSVFSADGDIFGLSADAEVDDEDDEALSCFLFLFTAPVASL